MELSKALALLEAEIIQMQDMLAAKLVSRDILKQTFSPQFNEIVNLNQEKITLSQEKASLVQANSTLVQEKTALMQEKSALSSQVNELLSQQEIFVKSNEEIIDN